MEEFKSINDVLDFAIRSEQEAVDFYTNLSSNASNSEMAEIFKDFAREEMGHKAKLMKIKEQGLLEIQVENIPNLKIAEFLVEMKATPDMSYSDALVLAMHKEKAAFKLYTRLAEKAPDSQFKEVFLKLAQEESKHKLRFELEYDEFILREN
jgi:rubrerythrin